MIILNNFGGFKKGRLWINEIPEIKGEVVDVIKLTDRVKSQQQWEKLIVFS